MEQWVPLFDIFLNSPTPEIEASLWLHRSFNVSSTLPISAASFLSLLTQPVDSVAGESDSSPPQTKSRVMFIQTLPSMVQSRILAFLSVEQERFCSVDLNRLCRRVLSEGCGVDFWVQSAARDLLDKLSGSGRQWVPDLVLGSDESRVEIEFKSLPGWLKDAVAVATDEVVLPWLPLSHDELNSRDLISSRDTEQQQPSLTQVGENELYNWKDVAEGMDIDHSENDVLDPEMQNMAARLRTRLMNVDSGSKTVELAEEIRELCVDSKADSLAVLGLIEPWKVDDESAAVLVSHLLSGSDEELAWPSHVISSVILPKLLALERPASRVLISSVMNFCKLHERAAEYGLLIPLLMRKDGINNPICEVITRIVKECLHRAHVSALCQKLFCGKEGERKPICQPCHQCLISRELVWTESLFSLIQNIMSHNVQLTQDTVDQLVHQVHNLAPRFSRSLKFGHFLLCLTKKFGSLLHSHKPLLTESVAQTNTLVTKSILSKLESL
ncbi:unnamed protein product [Linum tenue]|uniref:Fanconi Anaemia group E protein C-terminal domain-containing protein n=1 Tax=Linum tenue TaxID=586396 RepID=A0AAV0QE79_9ROSI|nr:unnamed protein product [Linum tenue]